MSFFSRKFHQNIGQTLPTATNSVLIGPVDIRNLDKFSICFQNSGTNNAFIDMVVQVAHDPTGTAADTAPNWVGVNTATILVPSALGSTAVTITSAIDNAWSWLRVLGRVANSATASNLTINIGGFTRKFD